jgi:EmrB/QacA subfamily drug resistance transporter
VPRQGTRDDLVRQSVLDTDQIVTPEGSAPVVHGDRYPWIALAVVFAGSFMVLLDTTIVNVALPQIAIDLEQGSGIEWVITAYLLAVGLVQPPTAWLADKYGRKRVFLVGLVVFGIGSLLAALSPNLGFLVATRVLQGLGGGTLMPVGLTIVYELFPADRRGMALGVWGVATMAGPAFGPVLGGYLVTAVSWHWLFFVNVPLCAIAVAVAARMLRDTGYRETRPFDGTGLGLVSVLVVSWLVAFTQASDWGWGSGAILGLLLLGLVSLVGFLRWERRCAHPLLDLTMLRVPIFTLTVMLVCIVSMVQYGIYFFVPLQLETLRGFSALRVGTILTPMALAAAITLPLGGRITDRFGPRIPVVTGVSLLGISALLLASFDAATPQIAIAGAVVVQGLGIGFAMTPNVVTGLNSLPMRSVASGTAVRMLSMRVAASFGVAAFATLLAAELDGRPAAAHADTAGAYPAYQMVFYIVAVVAVAGACLACLLPNRQRARALVAERAAEIGAPAVRHAASERSGPVPAD